LWETATDAVLLLTPEAVVEFANPAVKQIFGYKPDELVGKNVDVLQPFFESLDPEVNWKRFIRLAHGTTAPGAIEATGKHKDGGDACLLENPGTQSRRSGGNFVSDEFGFSRRRRRGTLCHADVAKVESNDEDGFIRERRAYSRVYSRPGRRGQTHSETDGAAA